MKKGISILNIFFFISFFYSCFLEPKSLKNIETGISGFKEIKENNNQNIKENNNQNNKKDIKENNNNISYIDKEHKLTTIKEGEVWELLLLGHVTWAKSGDLIDIKDKYNNLIEDLKGLKYSYIFSPIRFKTSSSWLSSRYTYYINDNNYKILSNNVPIAKIIAFESTTEFEKKYEVQSLKLISAGSNIDFEKHRTGFAAIKLKETSKETGYINSYNFGVFNDDLTNSFNLLWKKKSEWSYMLAQLTIKDKKTNTNKTYEIVLSPKIFNDTIKLIYAKYPNLSKEKLKPPIDE
ncbi:S2/P23 family protein [Borreliella lusitaniae]|uniref:S2/P23 family protein n=1 Tax=Borreliella lusitaniae TaxID=100177 RepID=UPI00292F4FE0|nr:S2/P23 family protein [Borreliella lusitaniae]WNY67257.1 S2/P23 family protein [Borreliella lusitaniae]